MADIIYMSSTAGTGYFFTTRKNKRQATEKLEIKRYDPKARKHVMFVETKSPKKKKEK